MGTPTTPDDRRLRTAIKADLAAANGLRLGAVGLMLLWLGYQWGFGNDATLPTLVANVALHFDDGSTMRAGAAAVGVSFLVGFGFTLVAQTIDVLVVTLGFSQLPSTEAWISRYLRAKGWVKSYDEMTWAGRWILSYGVGASTLVLADRFARDLRQTPDQRKIATIGIALSASTIGLVTAIIVTILLTTLRFPATRGVGEVVIDIVSFPLTWLALFGTIFLVGRLRARNDAD